MANDDKTLELLRRVARRWASEHFAAVAAELERQARPSLSHAVISDISAQGWLPTPQDQLRDWSPPMLASLGLALGEQAATAFLPVLAHCVAARLLAVATGREWSLKDDKPLLAASPYWDFSRVRSPVVVSYQADTVCMTGTLPMVVNAESASFIVVPVSSTEGELAVCGVKAESPGVNLGECLPLLGLRGVDCRNVRFESVTLYRDRVICRGQQAIAALADASHWLGWGALGLLAGIVGRACEQAGEYANLRIQGGRRIIEHSAVASLMQIAVQARDQLLTWLDSAPGDLMQPAPLRQARSLALGATDASLQVNGGMGYMCPAVAERCWRDARQAATLCSTTACVVGPSQAGF